MDAFHKRCVSQPIAPLSVDTGIYEDLSLSKNGHSITYLSLSSIFNGEVYLTFDTGLYFYQFCDATDKGHYQREHPGRVIICDDGTHLWV